MQSLSQEIQGFSKARLRKQCTRVTSLSGRRIIETWLGSTVQVVEDPQPDTHRALGYVPDTSWDLQVGVIKPFLLLGSQDAAHDFSTLKKHQVSHILNVAYGVENTFTDLFIYKTLSILDHPDTDITVHLTDCSLFIDQAQAERSYHRCPVCAIKPDTGHPLSETWQELQLTFPPLSESKGVVLVHCNAGVSRAAAVVIGYLMLRDGQPFDAAFSLVKAARPASCPNPGFLQQLRSICPAGGTPQHQP